MKNILIVFTVLAMASAANAAVLISVGGDHDDPVVELLPDDHAVIDIWGDGQTDPYGFMLGVKAGDLGVLTIDNADVLYPGSEADIMMVDDAGVAGMMGVDSPFIYIELTDLSPTPLPLTGVLVDLIDFQCTGFIVPPPTPVTLLLYDIDLVLVDSQVIKQIPEPMTMALLGLGGLFLRRRK